MLNFKQHLSPVLYTLWHVLMRFLDPVEEKVIGVKDFCIYACYEADILEFIYGNLEKERYLLDY